MQTLGVKALVFDVFGTVVDWRSGVIRDATPFLAKYGGAGADPAAFADAWRAGYSPAMEEVRSGRRPFTRLDVLHRRISTRCCPRSASIARAWPTPISTR
ncbi:putative haloacid dehalogenase, type II [Burkholderia pseudomallei]|nr:haloacid dehalogenase, type II [Burkholderia pseudomallei 668]AJX89294.1 putative haloacid dehalogenase, type II [Burkholderia pseudomallei]